MILPCHSRFRNCEIRVKRIWAAYHRSLWQSIWMPPLDQTSGWRSTFSESEVKLHALWHFSIRPWAVSSASRDQMSKSCNNNILVESFLCGPSACLPSLPFYLLLGMFFPNNPTFYWPQVDPHPHLITETSLSRGRALASPRSSPVFFLPVLFRERENRERDWEVKGPLPWIRNSGALHTVGQRPPS